MFKGRLSLVIALTVAGAAFLAISILQAVPGSAQSGCQTFKETGKTICGRFLEYWQKNGGLAQQGYPLTGEFTEESDLDHKPYTVQYFERAVFEKHPENKAPYDVLLSQLGTYQLKNKYKDVDPAQATPVPLALMGQKFLIIGEGKLLFEVNVTNVQEIKNIPGDAAKSTEAATAQGKYVVAFITAKNLANESDSVESVPRLKDKQNRIFDAADIKVQKSAAAYFKRNYDFTDVQPTFSDEEVIVFDVAADSTDYILVP